MLSLAKFIKKEIQLRENLVGQGFLAPPQSKQDKEKKFTTKRNYDQEDKEEAPTRVTVVGK
jgi:hypothetical protein